MAWNLKYILQVIPSGKAAGLVRPVEFVKTFTFMRKDNEKKQKNKSSQELANRLHENAAEPPQFTYVGIQQSVAQGNQGDYSRI